MKLIKYVGLKLARLIYDGMKRIDHAIERRYHERFLEDFAKIGSFTCKSFDYRIIGAKYISIGSNFVVGKCLRIEAIDTHFNYHYQPRLKIGNDVRLEDYCHIACIDNVEIGDGVLIASKVLISDHLHGKTSEENLNIPPIYRPLMSKPVKIGNNVWIGDNVCIMPGVTLGNNVIVGANSVVTKSFPENAVIAGVPAKLIRFLTEISS